MRIALVSREYPPFNAKGGIGSQTLLKARGLVSRGHQVHVVTRSADNQAHDDEDGPVHVLRIPGIDGRMAVQTEAVEWLTYSAEVAAAVSKLHQDYTLDLVDFPEWGGEGYIFLLNRSEWNSTPRTVVHIHGPLAMFAHLMNWPERSSDFYRVGSEMEGASLRLADAAFASSCYSADWCARHYGLDRSRIPTLHAGVDIRLFRPGLAPKEERLTILFAGKVTQSKGVVELAEAVCLLAKEFPGLLLRLLGNVDEAMRTKLTSMAAESGPSDLLRFEGFVPRDRMPEEMCRAHVFAAPSRCEGGPGFVYLEAMACGLPVVACRGTGAEEAVNEEVGALVRPGDVTALANALRRLLIDAVYRDRVGRQARSVMEREADSEVCVGRIESFYSSVLARPIEVAGRKSGE